MIFDFGFAPGKKDEGTIALVRKFMRLRANTSVVNNSKITTVRGFIQRLIDEGDSPVGDLLIGTHATDRSILIHLFPGQKGSTKFETIGEAQADGDKSIFIPDSLLGQGPQDPISHVVHIVGCNIGTAKPFLEKLQQAFGGRVKVTAPTRFDGFTELPKEGMLQFMDYEFVIRRKTRFASRVDAVAAFQKEGFTLIDGSVVADAKWEEWIPKKITETDRAGVVANLGLTLGRRTTVRLAREFRVETGSKSAFNYDIPFIPPAKVPPPDQREPLFRTRIRDADPTFQTSHPFPQFIRFGYGDVDKFLDGYLWKFTKVVTKGGEVLHVHGDRVVYTAAIPITDAANALFFNFEPKEGGDLPFHQGLNEDDTRFFLTVPE